MYVDLNVKPYKDVDLRRLLETARRLGYRAVAVEGLDKRMVEQDLVVVPRTTYSYLGRLTNISGGSDGYLIAYELTEPTMFKSLNSLRGRCHVVKLSPNALKGIKKKYISSLRNCGIPVEVSLKDMLTDNGVNYSVLRGLNKLLEYIEKGDIELAVSSSAGDVFELIHPYETVSLLRELGLSELTSVKAVSSLPARILRVVSDAG